MGVQSLSHWPASGSSELSIFPQAGSHPEGTGPDPRLLPPKPVNLCSCLSSAQTILAQAASRVSLGPSPASSAIQPPTFPKGLSPTPVLLVLPRPAHPLLPRFSSSVNVQLPVVPCDGSFRALVPGVQEACFAPCCPDLHNTPPQPLSGWGLAQCCLQHNTLAVTRTRVIQAASVPLRTVGSLRAEP